MRLHRRTHADRPGEHTGLTRWVRNYFRDGQAGSPSKVGSSPRQASTLAFDTLMSSKGSSVQQTELLPLYLQHQGHSRTIVGMETSKSGETHLLLFDPGRCVRYSPWLD